MRCCMPCGMVCGVGAGGMCAHAPGDSCARDCGGALTLIGVCSEHPTLGWRGAGVVRWGGASSTNPRRWRTSCRSHGRVPPGSAQAQVFHAGTTLGEDGRLTTSGGRVLCVTALGDSVRLAQHHAYAALNTISFDGAQWRRDIGHRAVKPR